MSGHGFSRAAESYKPLFSRATPRERIATEEESKDPGNVSSAKPQRGVLSKLHEQPAAILFNFALLQFLVWLTGVGWIFLRALYLVLLLRVPAFIGSTTTLTACRIWLLSLRELSCLNVSAVVTRSCLCLWLRLNPSTWTWISPIRILRHDLTKRADPLQFPAPSWRSLLGVHR